ncbi:MAG: putative cytochrome [Chloroflexi bacterium]|nr:putative cytochrome [Chloroflexota bacterium]
MPATIPSPSPQAGLIALKALLRERSLLAPLQRMNLELGDIFQIQLPNFTPIFMVGPEAAHFVLVDQRGELRWRNENDPVTHLLRHGVLVEDGDEHDRLRHLLNPSLHKQMLVEYITDMWCYTQQVTAQWKEGVVVDILDEMRKIALLVLMRTLYQLDFSPQLRRMWDVVIDNIKYVSPGLWMLWSDLPRHQYNRAIHKMDRYLYQIIQERRKRMTADPLPPRDMLGQLIASGMEDGLIRDQLLTMLIAGHDTVTALMAWTLYLLSVHPDILKQAQDEVDNTLYPGEIPSLEQINQLVYLNQVIKESLRLFPPIHLGSRISATDLEFKGYHIPANRRVVYSIYLTQRHPAYWPEPDRFDPDRHAPGTRPAPYTWLPFGGGPRNCIGAAFGQMEARVVVANVLLHFDLHLVNAHVKPHMGATLEPHGARMRIERRSDYFI